MSADGSVVVGVSNSSSGGDQAFRWTASTGMQSVKNLLQAAGVNIGSWSLTWSTGVTANGQVIVGYGQNPSGQTEAWIARLASTTPRQLQRRRQL